jgi:hypothetical protein
MIVTLIDTRTRVCPPQMLSSTFLNWLQSTLVFNGRACWYPTSLSLKLRLDVIRLHHTATVVAWYLYQRLSASQEIVTAEPPVVQHVTEHVRATSSRPSDGIRSCQLDPITRARTWALHFFVVRSPSYHSRVLVLL